LHLGHCHVPCTNAIGVGQRQHISTSATSPRVRHTADVRRVALALIAASLVGAAAAPAADVTLRIIFPEGMSVRQMADQVSAVRRIAIRTRHVTPVLTGKAYAAAAGTTSPPAAFRAADKRHSIEGFLFPAGYDFGPSTKPIELIRLQLGAFAWNWAQVHVGTRRPYDVLIVASMIERETVAPAERKLVSAVIWNRLKKGMPLGIDATLRYGLGIQGTRPITAAEQRNQTPYNTNVHTGLPPTPIGNPGLPSLQAAAHPARVDYLYYVRKPDGVHHFFTASEAEFCKKAEQYGYHC
jgi:uncharacterized YceG family protein